MTIGFHIEYHTAWGERICILGSSAALGSNSEENAPEMHTTDGKYWSLSIDVNPGEEFSYSYFLKNDSGIIRREWGKPRSINPGYRPTCIEIIDRWHDRPENSPFYSSAFSSCIFKRNSAETPGIEPQPGKLTLVVEAPMITPTQSVYVCGNTDELGGWNADKAAEMTPIGFPLWKIDITVPNHSLEYKFLVGDTTGIRTWENRDHRTFHPTGFPANTAIINHCGGIANPMPLWRGAGVAIPVFSLRSDDDMGIGDFADIKLIIDWAAATGQKIVQILPINDTTTDGNWGDSYPYSAISSFALNPIYLRLQQVGMFAEKKKRDYFSAVARKLNSLPQIDYPAVFSAKMEYLHGIFEEQGNKTIKSESYKKFVNKNAHWLKPYIAFCILRDKFGTTDMTQWGDFKDYSADKAQKVISGNKKASDFYQFLQYHLDAQLREARDHGMSLGVALKGDIPIGVSRTSVDAWVKPELFNLDASAGAPPDAFAVNGQNWGFPTYNWDEMSKDGFAWWKARFGKMADYFDAYRIDHLLGFFRIWQIPLSAVHGLLGIFNSAIPYTPEEMKYDYDFSFDRNLHTTPYITDEIIEQLFGYLADTVRSEFLTGYYGNRYRLRDEFDTQHKIASAFENREKSADNSLIQEGLFTLAENVLFIEDPYRPNHWHPRISADKTFAFKALSQYERDRYSALYHDFFFNRNNSYWREKALWKLQPLIDSTGMLCCGEDLGMIPACVPSVMEELEILSLKVQRMPDQPDKEFADTRMYPYYCVATIGTHDMCGFRQWWEEDNNRAQRFYNDCLGLKGEAPASAETWICDRVVSDHLTSPAMLCILPLQDWLALEGKLRRYNPAEEQINNPADPNNRWNYRMHLSLQKLLKAKEFNSYLKKKNQTSGRQ
ncbi:MAG: 4-alpha-glucanotransferase [Paramuribaculum sp.]|nr:4-alpha-glucanotransferase [Paramuribaculum sp.]